jgi:hypothetical protein
MRPSAACLFAVFIVVLAPGCNYGAPQRTLVPPGGADVPIRMKYGVPIVDVLVNGKGPYPFVLDTGTSCVFVAPALAKELGLPRPGFSKPARDAHGKVHRVSATRIDRLSIGGAKFEVLDALVDEPMFNDVAGLLGMRLFGRTVVTVRFADEHMTIGSHHVSASDPNTLPVRLVMGVATVPVSPPVRGPRWTPYVFLDTGMNGGFTLPAPDRRHLSLDPVVHSQVHTRAPTGVRTLDVVRLKGPMDIGPYTAWDATVALEPGGRRGRLGSLFLRRFDVTIDTAAKRVRLFLRDPAPATRPATTRPTALIP